MKVSLSSTLARIGRGYARDIWRSVLPMFIIALMAYAQDYLVTDLLGIPRGIERFMVWNIVYTLGWQFAVKGRCRSFPEALYVLAANTTTYLWTVFLKSQFTTYKLVWLYMPLFTFMLIPTEFLHFKLFGNTNKDPAKNKETYIILKEKKLKDNLLVVIFSAIQMIGASFLECSKTASGWRLFLVFVPMNLVSDTFFGVPHNLAHRVPWLWKRHKLHHAYRGDNLISFANFYSDLLDGFLMSYAQIFAFIIDVFIDVPVWGPIDSTALTAFSHHKYAAMYITYFGAYEIDILADVLLGRKLAAYHNDHHTDLSKRFSVLGFASDETLSAVGDLFMPAKQRGLPPTIHETPAVEAGSGATESEPVSKSKKDD